MPTPPTTALSRTRYFWLWLTALGAALGILLLAHAVAGRLDPAIVDARVATAGVIFVVSLSLAVVGRAVHVIVTAAFSDSYRVFRARHLFVCATVLLGAGALAAGAVVLHDPFGKLFAHGRITREDLIDVGTVIAAVVCIVGAGVALCGAWDSRHEERNWHRTLHLHRSRRI